MGYYRKVMYISIFYYNNYDKMLSKTVITKNVSSQMTPLIRSTNPLGPKSIGVISEDYDLKVNLIIILFHLIPQL